MRVSYLTVKNADSNLSLLAEPKSEKLA